MTTYLVYPQDLQHELDEPYRTWQPEHYIQAASASEAIETYRLWYGNRPGLIAEIAWE